MAQLALFHVLVLLSLLLKNYRVKFALCVPRWKGDVSVPWDVFDHGFHSPVATIFCNWFYFIFPLYFTFFILTLFLCASCAGFFLIMTHFQAYWVLLGAMFYRNISLDAQPPKGGLGVSDGQVWVLTGHHPLHLPVQHAASGKNTFSGGLRPISSSGQVRTMPPLPSGYDTYSDTSWPAPSKDAPSPRPVLSAPHQPPRLPPHPPPTCSRTPCPPLPPTCPLSPPPAVVQTQLCLALVEVKCASLSPFLCLLLFSEERGEASFAVCHFTAWHLRCLPKCRHPGWSQWVSRSSHVIWSLLPGACGWGPLPNVLRHPLARPLCSSLHRRLPQPAVGAASWLTVSCCSGKLSWCVLMISHPSLFSLEPWVLKHFTPQLACLWLSLLSVTLSLLDYFSLFCDIFSLDLLCNIKFSNHFLNLFPVLYLFVNSILFLH